MALGNPLLMKSMPWHADPQLKTPLRNVNEALGLRTSRRPFGWVGAKGSRRLHLDDSPGPTVPPHVIEHREPGAADRLGIIDIARPIPLRRVLADSIERIVGRASHSLQAGR